MHPAITPRCRCSNRPGWALAQRELFDLLDHAWRRFAARLHRPGRAAELQRTADHPRRRGRLLRGLLQLAPAVPARRRRRPAAPPVRAALGGRHPAADRTGHAPGRVRARLRLVPPGREPAAALLPVHGRPRALARARAALRRALRRSRRTATTTPSTASSAARTTAATRERDGLFDGDAYPWLPKEAEMYGFPLDWILPAGAAAQPPLVARTRGSARRCAAAWASATPRSTSPPPDSSSTPGSSPASSATADWIAEYVGAWRERADGQRRHPPGQRRPGRHRRRPAGGPLVRRPLRLVLAARLVQRRTRRRGRRPGRGATATGDDSYLDLVAPRARRDHRARQGDGLHRGRLQHPRPSGPPSWPRTSHTPTLHVPVPARRRAAGSTTTRCRWPCPPPCGTTPPPTPTARASSGCARPPAYDWRTVRPFRSKEEAGHEEPWFAFLAGDDPGYPERILAAAQAQVRHRLTRMERYRDLDVPEADIHLWQQSQPGGHRGPGPAHLGRPAGALQRRPAAGPRALLRRRRPPPRTAAGGRGPGLHHRPARRPSSTWSTSTRERARTVIVQAGAFAEHTIRTVELHRLRGPLLDRRPVRLRAHRTGRDRRSTTSAAPGSPSSCPAPHASA